MSNIHDPVRGPKESREEYRTRQAKSKQAVIASQMMQRSFRQANESHEIYPMHVTGPVKPAKSYHSHPFRK